MTNETTTKREVDCLGAIPVTNKCVLLEVAIHRAEAWKAAWMLSDAYDESVTDTRPPQSYICDRCGAIHFHAFQLQTC